MIHSKVKDLPECIQSALKSVGYGRADIRIDAAEKTDPGAASGSGQKAFCIIINMATGEVKEMFGSWGGQNLFNADNQVDNDRSLYDIPSGYAVIKGSIGGQVYAYMTVHPDNIVKYLPVHDVELDARDKWILYTFDGLTSAGRRNEWERCNDKPSEDDLNRLAAKGYLKRNKNGATQITTEGKNALGRKAGVSVEHPNSRW